MSDIGITLRGNHSGLNASLQKAGADVKKFGDDATKSLRGVQDETRNLHKTLSALGGQMGTALTAAFAVNKVADFTHAIIDAQTNLDKLHNTLSFSLGAGQVTGQMDYLRKTTNALGLEFGSTAVMYAKFAAAARGTSMEGRNTQKVFESIGKASTVMGLSAADTQGVMLALTQILSKGTTQAEEIRGQLGERLPGAFAIASRAMGVTTQEFSKMLELGQVVSADFLPKFAAQMEKEVAGSFDKASQSMQASLNRMSNAWLEFKQTVAQSGAATAIAAEVNGLTNYISLLTETMQKARANGSGAMGEISAAVGTMIARAPFDVLAFSANTLNGTLNLLSMGALKLNTNVDTLPAVFDTAAQRSAALDSNLIAAEKDLAQLRSKLDQVPDNIYLKSETHQAWLLVQELRAAKAAKDGLSGNTGPGNVSGIAAQYPTRSQSYAADAERINKIRAGYEAVQQSLSGVSANYLKNLAALKAGFDEGLTTQEQYTKDVIALIDKETGFKKTAAKAQSDAAKAQEEARKAAARAEADWQNEVFKAAESEFDAREKAIKTLKDQIDKETAHTAALGLSKEAIADLEVATLYETAAAKEQLATRADQIDWSGQMGNAYREEARLLRELAAAKKAGGVRASELESEKEAKKYADDMLKEQKRAAEESAKYWEDALMRAFESGKGFFQSLWDTIKNTLKTQVLKVLVSATGLTGMSAAGANTLSGSGGNLLGVASSLGNIYNTISAGFTGLGDSVAFAAQDMGAWLVNNTSGLLNQAGSSLMQSAGTFGTVAGYAAGAAAGLAIGNAISGQYGSSNTVTAGTIIGSVVGGPIGGAIGGAIGGIINRAFGMGDTEVRATGTRGTFSGDSFTGSNYATMHQDGGWFRSDRDWTDTSAIDPATVSAWSTAFAGVKGSVAGMAASLGLATDKIAAYSKAVDVAAGTTAEQMTALFTGMADDMALAAAPSLAQFAKTGEVASTTLARLSGSLQTVNMWLGTLDHTLLAVSLSGGDAASKLADAFGGLDAMATASKAYYDQFWTDAERLSDTATNVAKGLALVNVAMPASKEAFKAVVSGLDLTTESGRSAYAVMMTLAPEFAQVADAAAAAATESVKLMNDVFDTLEDRLVNLVDSIASERAAVAGASAGMLGLQPKTAAQLAVEIAGAKVALPSDAALLAANATLAAAAANVAAKNTAVEQARALSPSTALLDAAKSSLDSAVATIAQRQTTADWYRQDQGGRFAGYVDAGLAGFDARGIYGESEELYSVTAGFMLRAANLALPPVQASYNAALADYSAAMTVYANNVAAAQATLSTATTAQSTAQATAKQALLNYAAAMTQYSGDAEKAVKVLSQLREETVAYYEAQKELAGLMTTSAANLRAAVRNSQFGQLASGAALAQQQRDFATNYSLALATGGATKAGYADNLTAALPALTSALMDTSSTRSAWALATAKLYSQSETIATQLDSAAAGMNYEAESLSLLGSIDVALGELDTNTAILKNAIDGGTATSAAGLRAIVTQLGGVPTFASGGLHAGGLRVVGENGPELEVTGPSRIFNASQTRGLLQGGGTSNQDLVNELRALRQSNENMRAELRAIASATVKTAKILGRVTQDGESITTTVLAA